MHVPVTRRTTVVATFVRTAVLALLLALAVTGLSARPAAAAEGDVAWTVRTASNSFGADRSSYSYAVNPGGKVEDAMVVANRGKAPVDLGVYAADGFTTDKGQLDLLPADKKSRAIGVWARAARERVVVQPGKTVEVPFTLAIPANATPGDYVGGILTSLTQPDDAQGINVDRRLGIKIKLRVSGAIKPTLAVEDLHVSYGGTAAPFSKGDATVTYRIRNTGNAIMSTRQSVKLKGLFGWFAVTGGKTATPPELLPGESWKVSVPVHDVAPAVRLTATVTLTPLFTDASGSTTQLKTVQSTAHTWAFPWTLTALVLVLLALAVAAFLHTRRTRTKRKAAEDARVRTAVEQALREA
ncbi:WxL protein peptidoglycan domain-containing protein [Streptomyces sp. NPDC088910]|uniref:WxL protein peptidoglycan domain-containing protein n=1 Tax=Streptomyces sp. NPDC088910 TaxID=3365911 RepID=UPI0037F72541